MMDRIQFFIAIFILFLTAADNSAAKSYEFSNYTGSISLNSTAYFLTPPRFGIVKKGDRLTFSAYSGAETHFKNILTYIKPQTPVLITAETPDYNFCYVETPLANGFIKKENLVMIDETLFNELLEAKKGLLKKPVMIDGFILPVATKLPIITKSKGKYRVRIYTDEPKDLWLTNKDFTEQLPLTRNNLKKLTSLFRGKPYAWGNSEQGWDCSGLLVDYFAFFGMELPRNSFQQINAVKAIEVENMSRKEKERILTRLKPYNTLLYFPGHIMLYTGKKGKELLSFQALNRIGKKRYGYVDYFPLKKTGLLSKVTKIGIIEPDNLRLTSRYFTGKI